MQQSSGLTPPYCADASRGGLLLRNILCFYSQQDQKCNVRRTCVSGETSNGSQTDASISRNFDFAEIQTAVGLLIKTEIMSEKGNPCSRCGPTEAEDHRSDPRCLWDDSKHFSQSTVRRQSDEMRSVRGKSDSYSLNRDVFDSFVEKCNRIYSPGQLACVDETLLGSLKPSSVSSTQANGLGL